MSCEGRFGRRVLIVYDSFLGGKVTLCFPRHQTRDVEVLFLVNLIGKK